MTASSSAGPLGLRFGHVAVQGGPLGGGRQGQVAGLVQHVTDVLQAVVGR